MASEFGFGVSTTRFDEHYTPSSSTRATTNFANLARGEHRQQNLRRALTMMENRFNDLADCENPDGRRYGLELDIVSVELQFAAAGQDRTFPLLEVLATTILDRRTGRRHEGIVGNNFSSYVRDFDFSVRLPAVNEHATGFVVPDDFGDLHGLLFRHFLDSEAYAARFTRPPVVCISVSTSRVYTRTDTRHPILGVEYRQDEHSLTDAYFAKMGLAVRYFMPRGAVAPLAFYFRGDLLNDYTDLQLVGAIAVMETFQKIYRPELYNANSAAGAVYAPTLDQDDFSRTLIEYDRAERSRLAVEQGRFTQEHLVTPHGDVLDQWAASRAALVG